MAKIGYEVEGIRHYGKRSLFVSAKEFVENYLKIISRDPQEFEQIYISDHDATLTFPNTPGPNLCKWAITVEVKKLVRSYPHYVGVMLNISDGTSVDQLNKLRYNDEIKVSTGLDVWSWSKRDAVRTIPSDFDDDTEVTL